ncbi:putative retinol dehydrogenase 12 [Halenospora varia]|nr:putative retinol dehydrogenase 12 [Halenospora varia]
MPAQTPNITLDAEKRASVYQFFYHLKGKIAIVTGSNTGIGLECACQLLDLGLSKLIIAVRDESKGQAASTNLSSGHMLSYDSVVAFAERAKTLKRLDIVVFNAGVMAGHEETIQGNFLSTALLTIPLLPILKFKDTNEPSRMVWVQSDMASWAKFKEQDSTPLLPTLDKPESFNLPDRYSTSKLLGQLFINDHGPNSHGQYLEDCKIQPVKGDQISELLWEETMKELAFAQAEDILKELGK